MRFKAAALAGLCLAGLAAAPAIAAPAPPVEITRFAQLTTPLP